MAKDDYTSSKGGALKLKGDGIRVDKKRSKSDRKEKKEKKDGKDKKEKSEKLLDKEHEHGLASEQPEEDSEETSEAAAKRTSEREHEGLRSADVALDAGKTEAERRHEEMRRRRLDERLKREGVKTHKERVEQLNKYLANLSEHHDMPRIGPG